MGFLARLGSLFQRKERELTPEELEQLEAVREQIRARCRHFRSLLAANKTALETMSDIEDHLLSARAFGMGYVKETGTRTATAVYQMVRELNKLTGDAWPTLPAAFTRVSSEMEAVLAPAPEEPLAALVLPLADISLADSHEVGGKMANLGEVASGAGLPVPPGFAITVSAYRHFLRENGLAATIEQKIRATDMDDMDALFSLSASLQQAVLGSPVPADLEKAIRREVDALVDETGEADIRLALRSSAVGEDALGASFAGQYSTQLNVLPDEVCDIWKEVIASKYTVTAMSYRYQRGIPEEAAPMCVGVIRMIRAVAGGVSYSVDPVASQNGTGNIVINAVPGLPAAVVDGRITPDTFTFSHSHPVTLIDRAIPVKASRLDMDETSALGMRTTELAPEEGAKPSISDEEARQVARMTLALEEYYNKPQDVEWAIERNADGTASFIILQSRPLQVETENEPPEESGSLEEAGSPKESGAQEEETENVEAIQEDAGNERSGIAIGGPHVLAEGGIAVSRGAGIGPVFVARRDADMLSFPQGGILVVERAHPRWAPLLPRAAGMISEHGGMAGHLASVAREYKVPALFGLSGATEKLDGTGVVTLDAAGKRVLMGEHPEFRKEEDAPPNLMKGSPVMRKMEELSRLVVPLHLLDPDASTFVPESCTSLHDITRFCHEQAARFMFDGEAGFEKNMGKQLKAGSKLQYWIIDMDDGFTKPIAGPVVDISEIASTPMLALWNGMLAVPWAGPPTASASGFMSVVFESAMNPELEVTAENTMAVRNYFIISGNYMLLQARYGYHFCTVESLATAANQENFVSFQFKGGAASLNRRRLRTRMIAELLEPYGFRCDVRSDSLFAVADGFTAEQTLLRTKLIGYLLIHTRQSDMIMEAPEAAAAFRAKLEEDMEGIAGKGLPREESGEEL